MIYFILLSLEASCILFRQHLKCDTSFCQPCIFKFDQLTAENAPRGWFCIVRSNQRSRVCLVLERRRVFLTKDVLGKTQRWPRTISVSVTGLLLRMRDRRELLPPPVMRNINENVCERALRRSQGWVPYDGQRETEPKGVLGWRVAFNVALNKSLPSKEIPASCFIPSLFHLLQ